MSSSNILTLSKKGRSFLLWLWSSSNFFDHLIQKSLVYLGYDSSSNFSTIPKKRRSFCHLSNIHNFIRFWVWVTVQFSWPSQKKVDHFYYGYDHRPNFLTMTMIRSVFGTWNDRICHVPPLTSRSRVSWPSHQSVPVLWPESMQGSPYPWIQTPEDTIALPWCPLLHPF